MITPLWALNDAFSINHYDLSEIQITEEYLKQAGVKLAWDYINEDEKFWKHNYRISMSVEATSKPVLCRKAVMIINADHEQDALDYAVDYLEEQGLEGFFLTNEEMEEQESEGIELTFAGNHSRALARPDLIRIQKLD